MNAAAQLALEITWDHFDGTGLRGILVVAVGIVVFMGSVYLLLGTNLGSRVGFLVAMAGLSGWMGLIGVVWALYGIGYQGPAAHWEVEEVVTGDAPDDLSASRLEKAHDLDDWTPLQADDPARGEAQAAASAALIDEHGPLQGFFESEAEFIVVGAYDVGGKEDTFFNNWFPGPHPPHYAIIQVQPVVEVEVPFGETPPAPEADESEPVFSVVMVRDLGARRLPSVTLAIFSFVVFGITCNVLHRRDKAVAAARAAAAAG